MKVIRIIVTVMILLGLIVSKTTIPHSNAKDENQLISIKSLDKKDIIYTINDSLVYWNDDNVEMYDIVMNHNIQAFSSSDFAKYFALNRPNPNLTNQMSILNGCIYLFNSKGLCCYDPLTGKLDWSNNEIIPQDYYQYYNPIVNNNGIIYVIKKHDNRYDEPPLLFCINSQDGTTIKQQTINTDKYSKKYKEIINRNAQIVSIYSNKLIIYPQGYNFYCYNIQTGDVEWISDFFLPLRWSVPKYTVVGDLFVFRHEMDDPTIKVPPCTIDDYYAPGVGVYSLKDGKRLFFKKAHDYVIRDNSLYLFKFSECSNETNIIEKYDLPDMKLVKTYGIPYKIKFTYANLDCTSEYQKLVCCVTEEGDIAYRLTSFDLDSFTIKESLIEKKVLNPFVRIRCTDNFMLVMTNKGMDVYTTKQAIFELYLRLVKWFWMKFRKGE